MTRLLPIDRNTDVVSLTIRAGGDDLPGWVRIASVEVQREVNRIPFARIRIEDGDAAAEDFRVSSGDYFTAGQEVVIEAGYHAEVAQIFAGIVIRQRLGVREGSSWLEVECRDVASRMTLARRHRLFQGMMDDAVIEEILSEYEIDADLAATDVEHAQLVQYQATDWDFVMTRLDANGQFCALEDGVLRSFAPELATKANATALYGTNLIELDAEFDARSQSGSIIARSWDPAEQSLQEIEAADPGWTLTGDLSAEDMAAAAGRDEEEIWHGGALAADALQAWADGMLCRARAAGTRGRAQFQGFAALTLGETLALDGLGARFEGGVLVTGLRHAFINNEWTLDVAFGLDRDLHAERFEISAKPASAISPAVSGLQVGVVTAISDDPAGEHRIRIKIPVAGFDEEGVWARLATLDAGNGRGTYFRPEVDDEVVVGFFHDDPAFPVVLGGLHSSAMAPPEEAAEGNALKGYTSREGLQVLFDDDLKAITLATPGGNTVLLSDDEGGIRIEDQNGNSIALTSDGIAIESANAVSVVAQGDASVEGLNVGLSASAALTAEGSASAGISSSGTLEVSGALVMIN